jgi:hypothetical protein
VDAASANAESAIAAVSEEQYTLALSIIDYFGRYVQSRLGRKRCIASINA